MRMARSQEAALPQSAAHRADRRHRRRSQRLFLKHDPEKLQTFRIRSCDRLNPMPAYVPSLVRDRLNSPSYSGKLPAR